MFAPASRGRLNLPAGAVWSLLALALVVRLLAVGAADGNRLGPDASDFNRHARSIAAGHGYPPSLEAAGGGPTAVRPPLYPYFLAGVYRATGNSVTAARVVQAVLGVAAVALLGVLAFQLFGRRAVLPALALGAVYPPLVLSASSLLTESIFAPLELGTLVAAMRYRDSPHPYRWALIAGALCGLAALSRQNGALLLIGVVPAILTSPGQPRELVRRLTPVAAMLLAFAACLIPWTIRNLEKFHAFRPVGDQTGLQLAGVMNDVARRDTRFPAAWRPPPLIPMYADLFRRTDLNELQLDRQLRTRAVEYLRHHPSYLLTVAYWNTRRILHLSGQRYERLAAQDFNYDFSLHEVGRFGFYAAAVLAILGAFTASARRAPLWFWLTPAAFFLSAVFSAGLIRYRAPVDPFLLLLGALAVSSAATRLARRADTRPA